CRNRQLSTPDARPDHEETLRSKSPARMRLDQSCAGRSVTSQSPITVLIRRLDNVANSPDLKM
ncbi:hypothetical protein Y032_1249g3782, partial [Ancylostoma ceylanicum]